MKRIMIVIVVLLFLQGCTPERVEEPVNCPNGFEPINDVCTQVEEDPIVCDEGYELVDNDCELIEEDPIVCDDGFELIDDACEEIDYTKTPNERGFLEFYYGDVTREYLMYKPDIVTEDTPIVIVMHGFTSNAFVIRDRTEFDTLAEEHGFIVLYPQGLASPVTHWNANLDISTVDDTGFLVSLVEYIQTEYQASTEYVFATGFSNGGFMSYTLACDAADTFTAIASVSGLMSGTTWDTCDVSSPMNILQIHGLDDIIVPPDGTMTTTGGWGGSPAVTEMMEYWKTLDQVDNEQVLVLNDYTTGYRYTSDTSENQVWLYLIEGYPHAWPGPNDAVFTFDEGLNATELIWEFFSLSIPTE